MNKCEKRSHDFSLISDISTLSDDEDEKLYNSIATSVKGNLITPKEDAFSTEFFNSKQVRFNSAVAVSSLGKQCTAFDGDATISDEKDDFTIITPDPNGNHDHSFKLDYANLDFNFKGRDNRQLSPLSSLDCSCLESYNNGPEDRSSPLSTVAEPAIHLDTSSFFRTSDHLPRIPIHEPTITDTSPAKLASSHDPSTESARNESDASIPRPHLKPLAIAEDEFSLSSSLELTSKGSTTFSPSPSIENLSDDVPNFSEPKSHIAHVLAGEIESLKEKLENQTIENPSEYCHHEAERLLNEACSSLICSHNTNRNWILNPHITVNISENVQTYTNLMDLSVDESEIVRQERARILRQRKRMVELRKKAAKDKPGELTVKDDKQGYLMLVEKDQPEPDLLEFFDPNRHVFQSINLHSKKTLNFLPSLSRASDDFVHIFEENLASELSRLM